MDIEFQFLQPELKILPRFYKSQINIPRWSNERTKKIRILGSKSNRISGKMITRSIKNNYQEQTRIYAIRTDSRLVHFVLFFRYSAMYVRYRLINDRFDAVRCKQSQLIIDYSTIIGYKARSYFGDMIISQANGTSTL